jgi:hypothetical protein
MSSARSATLRRTPPFAAIRSSNDDTASSETSAKIACRPGVNSPQSSRANAVTPSSLISSADQPTKAPAAAPSVAPSGPPAKPETAPSNAAATTVLWSPSARSFTEILPSEPFPTNAALGRRPPRRLALHRARQAEPERVRRKLQRQAQGRTAQRDAVPFLAARSLCARRLAPGPQSAAAAFAPRLADATGLRGLSAITEFATGQAAPAI